MVIDGTTRTITIDGRVVRPQRMSFDLCAYLAAHPGAVRSRIQIMDAIGAEYATNDRCVDTHVKRARKAGVTQIMTAHGVGYYWQE